MVVDLEAVTSVVRLGWTEGGHVKIRGEILGERGEHETSHPGKRRQDVTS